MPLLQVRDFPQQLYDLLAICAEEQNRSITQQTIYLLKQQLVNQSNINASNRKKVLLNLEQLNLSLPDDAPTATEIIAKDRLGNFDISKGRLR